ncbi:hypothetical protein LOC71_18310 [Rhodopirellula sp. JC740]|uniref:Formylmethanofuran dehydrogenase subunit B n=1 Tax=Rhodopirellula halodulae TaxID=2894198 RepID=A0ABS8NKZ6_9BACT|nr:hypothetical protein [Rhodopirellula sp. JC740]
MSESSRVVCPLCPLHCDDVLVASDGKVSEPACAAKKFATLDSQTERISGVNLRQIASTGKPIRVITTGVDLVAARQLVQWQQEGTVDVKLESDPSVRAIGTVTGRDGIVSATLSELVTHADLVWLIGDAQTEWPRFEDRIRLDQPVPNGSGKTRVVKRWERWAADFAGRMHHAIEHPNDDSIESEFQSRANDFRSSEYAAVVIAPGAFDPEEAEMTAAMVARIVRRRNESARCVCITLDPASTMRGVHAWQTNESLAVVDSDEEFASDAFTVRVVGIGENHPLTRRVDLQIGGEDPGADLAKAFMPASPWVNSMVVRGDGSVTLPLEVPAAVSGESPTVIEQLQKVMSK